DYRSSLATAELSLALDLPAGPVWVEGDATRLIQVVTNLLQNAAKYTDRGGQVNIQVASERAQGRVCVSVRDTGIGIPAEELPRVFEAFVQASPDSQRAR